MEQEGRICTWILWLLQLASLFYTAGHLCCLNHAFPHLPLLLVHLYLRFSLLTFSHTFELFVTPVGKWILFGCGLGPELHSPQVFRVWWCLCSKEDVSASVQPSPTRALILKAAAFSFREQEDAQPSTRVWIEPLVTAFSLPFKPLQVRRNRQCPGQQATLSQSFKLSEVKVPKSCIPTGFVVPLLLTSRPRGSARAPRGEERRGRRGVPRPGGMRGMRMACLSGQLQSRAQGWLSCHLLWAPRAHSNSGSGMGLLLFFSFFSPVKKFFPALFPAPACAHSWISGNGAGIPAPERCVLKEKGRFRAQLVFVWGSVFLSALRREPTCVIYCKLPKSCSVQIKCEPVFAMRSVKSPVDVQPLDCPP